MILKLGSKGSVVSNLQKNLKQLGVLPIDVDGDFGPQTLSAVRAFQVTHGLEPDGEVGDLTQMTIAKALIGQIPPNGVGPAPWLSWMRSHLGEKEMTGATPTPFDEEIFSHTNYGPLHGVMEPGCAATACAALEECGYKSTHNAAAQSFHNFGEACELKPGAIVGFNWSGGTHADHVTFCDHVVDGKYVACLGGNQSHEVRVSTFSKACVVFVRWPTEKL